MDSTLDGREPWLPQIRFAMERRHRVRLEGATLCGNKIAKSIWVCNAEVFLLLKSVAFRRRGRERFKDAHDLYFVLRYYPGDLASSVAELMMDPEARDLLDVLKESFVEHDDDGPLAVARFTEGRPDDGIQADVAGATRRLLERLFLI